MLSHDPLPDAETSGRCVSCRHWRQDHIAEHRGKGIRVEVQWKSCVRGEYLAARTGNPYTSEDFGCILWEGGATRRG